MREAYLIVDRASASADVGGMPYMLRTLLTLQHAGIERCVIVGDVDAPRDPRLTLSLLVDRKPPPLGSDAPTLVIGNGTVVDGTLLDWLAQHRRDDEIVDLRDDDAHVRLAPGRRALPLTDVPETGPAPAGTLKSATDPAVDGLLLRGLENHRDGYFDRLLYRRLSRPISRRLLARGTSPNTVTLVGIALGMLGGLALGYPGPASLALALGALLASNVLDCVDGELARVRFAESRLGHFLDVTGDTVVHLAVFAGITRYLSTTNVAIGATTLWLLGLGVLGSFAAITWSEVSEERRHRVATWENDVLDRVLSPLTTRDWYVFPVLFALAGRLDLLVVMAAVGSHGFWALVAVLVRRVLRQVP